MGARCWLKVRLALMRFATGDPSFVRASKSVAATVVAKGCDTVTR